ncbi:MAG: hypothetical protein Q7K71_07385 [Candidatus Omnitrophota bacterium]|nr:hypothetical protein [Candidatus Omnitrophota bacterium]
MRIALNKKAEECLAKIYGDLGKNIVSIGVASYFFKELPLPFRIVLFIIGIGLLVLNVYLISKKGE